MFVPDQFVIDPSPHGVGGSGIGNFGTLKILGNLKVEGTYEAIDTTVTTNNLEVVDKTITVGSGNSDVSSGAIMGAGMLVGGSTISGALKQNLASLTYQYDADAIDEQSENSSVNLYHKRYFESSVPIRYPTEWRAKHNDEVVTYDHLRTGGDITYDALQGIKFKVVSSAEDACFSHDNLKYGGNNKIMLWVLNIGEGNYPFCLDVDGSGTGMSDQEGDMMVYPGMNFFVYDGHNWHSQV